MPEQASTETFDSVKERLEEIAEAVAAEDIGLDAALALYEEAVGLGLAACDLSEADLKAARPEEAPEQEAQAQAPDAPQHPDAGAAEQPAEGARLG